MRAHLRGLLETRLRLVNIWKKADPRRGAGLRAANGSIHPVKRPIFIVGVPRSGSTYLHELLAQNPDYRAPRVWEVMFRCAAGTMSERCSTTRSQNGVLPVVFAYWHRRRTPYIRCAPLRRMNAWLFIVTHSCPDRFHLSHSFLRKILAPRRSHPRVRMGETLPPISPIRTIQSPLGAEISRSRFWPGTVAESLSRRDHHPDSSQPT